MFFRRSALSIGAQELFCPFSVHADHLTACCCPLQKPKTDKPKSDKPKVRQAAAPILVSFPLRF